MSTEIGSLGTAGAFQERTRSYTSDGSIVDEYVVATADESTFLSGYIIGTSVADGFILGEARVRRARSVSRVSLVYVEPSTLTQKYKEGDNPVQSSGVVATSFPIWQHPDIVNPNGYETNEAPIFGTTAFPGVDSYFAPSATYTYETVENSFSFSESNILDNVGIPDNPTGMTSVIDGAWLKVGKDVRQNGDKYSIVETWQHAGIVNGTSRIWAEEIYGTSTP